LDYHGRNLAMPPIRAWPAGPTPRSHAEEAGRILPGDDARMLIASTNEAMRPMIRADFATIEELGYLEKTEPHTLQIGTCSRCHTVVEPLMSWQWFVKMAPLAKPGIDVVREGRITFVPDRFERIYLNWMENIRDWCVSRQLWWGHRIPAWYGPDGKIFVEETEEKAKAAAREVYGRDEPLRQDEDVLDTWFSSGLWPFSTLGWPEETADLARFYPTNTLVTGFDIIFYWVARMMMLGIHFTGQVPFKRVFFNALVRDASGAKMSKSKGNVMDPLELVDQYGADPLRFTLTAMSGQGRDIKLSVERIEGYRNFGTKLWNATNFAQVNGAARAADFDPAEVQNTLNRWIIGEAARTSQAVTEAIASCSFDGAANTLYRFIWDTYCAWYVELAKPLLGKPGEAVADEAARAETQATVGWVLDVILKLLHPIMPFLTEELWAQTSDLGAPRSEGGMLITAHWPDLPATLIDVNADAEIGLIIATVTEGRAVRKELNVPHSARPALLVIDATSAQREVFQTNASVIAQILRVSSISFEDTAPVGAVPFVVSGATLALPVAEFIDLAVEKARLAKEITTLASDIAHVMKKLGNPDFVARAKEEVVEENRERLAESEAAKAKLEGALARLEAVV
ncbi:class I tRNA ligase family protein, partial [Phenylobacterium sp.]|uniref:class I tRNA ligase family protein n=1 Tax=Phenylobacterium sp. TaxID=1871053 RepID=UPI002722F8B0